MVIATFVDAWRLVIAEGRAGLQCDIEPAEPKGRSRDLPEPAGQAIAEPVDVRLKTPLQIRRIRCVEPRIALEPLPVRHFVSDSQRGMDPVGQSVHFGQSELVHVVRGDSQASVPVQKVGVTLRATRKLANADTFGTGFGRQIGQQSLVRHRKSVLR